MWGTCVRCGSEKELAKTPDFCPECGGTLRPDPSISKASTGPDISREAHDQEEKVSVISPELGETWTKKIKHKRKDKGKGEYFTTGDYAV